MNQKYKDILHKPHHVSTEFPPMPLRDRAAQFSPFAAMVGHDAMIEEAARYVETRPEVDEAERERIDETLRAALENSREIEIMYFVPDEKKVGGACLTTFGRIQKIDPLTGLIIMEAGGKIPVNDIVQVN